jgi:hypothetical protein
MMAAAPNAVVTVSPPPANRRTASGRFVTNVPVTVSPHRAAVTS